MPLNVKKTLRALADLKHHGDHLASDAAKQLGLTPAEVVELTQLGLAAVHQPTETVSAVAGGKRGGMVNVVKNKGPAVVHITARGGKFLQDKLEHVKPDDEKVAAGSAEHIAATASTRKGK